MKIKDLIQKVITACKDVSAMATEEERKRDQELWINFLSISAVAFIFIVIVYALGKYILIPLLPLIIVLFLYKLDNEPSQLDMQTIVSQEMQISCELLCTVLSEHASVLEVVPPKNISDITPIAYPVLQFDTGLRFYRFIIMPNPNSHISLEEQKNTLFIFVAQHLQGAICPNLQYRQYRDMPYFTVFNVDTDYHHTGYLHIDIMPVCNDACYNYVVNRKILEQQREMNGHMTTPPQDEDF